MKRSVTVPNVKRDKALCVMLVQGVFREQAALDTIEREIKRLQAEQKKIQLKLSVFRSVIKTFSTIIDRCEGRSSK